MQPCASSGFWPQLALLTGYSFADNKGDNPTQLSCGWEFTDSQLQREASSQRLAIYLLLFPLLFSAAPSMESLLEIPRQLTQAACLGLFSRILPGPSIQAGKQKQTTEAGARGWGSKSQMESTPRYHLFWCLLLSSRPSLAHSQPLSEPVVIKPLWLDPLWTCNRIFMSNLLFFFFKCQQLNLFFGFFFAALEEVNFSYRQEGDLLLNKIETFFLLATVLLKTKLPCLNAKAKPLSCECVCVCLPVYVRVC